MFAKWQHPKFLALAPLTLKLDQMPSFFKSCFKYLSFSSKLLIFEIIVYVFATWHENAKFQSMPVIPQVPGLCWGQGPGSTHHKDFRLRKDRQVYQGFFSLKRIKWDLYSALRHGCGPGKFQTFTVLKSRTFSVVNAGVLRGHCDRLRKFLTLFLWLTLDVYVICSTLSGVNCGPFWYFGTLSGVNCGQFWYSILALLQVLIAESFGILALFQVLIADNFGIITHSGKINTIQGLNPWPPASLLSTLPTVSPIHWKET